MLEKTPALMVQGTCSNAGKSLLVAALCRIFAEEGWNPAPFKAQNMALNSFVTEDGLELGRAQALQAAACGRAPDVRMNPVLLKPSSDTGSQVIVMGRAVGQMRIGQYMAYKAEAWKAITRAYDALSAEAGVMVIEGAGSPAEINLQAHDIVNMAVARYARAPVLLVGDIDRGGVFAALVGTLELLSPEDRERVAGFVLNKFRGDPGLLTPALEMVSARTGRPFLGTVPWIRDLDLPEEDSVSFKAGARAVCGPVHGALDIALVDVPHISNATDVDPLRVEPDVRVRVVRRPRDLGSPDAIILPGSKNTPGDLRALRASGMAELLCRRAREARGPVVVGICGGLQMLGERIADPLGVESAERASLSGLGLLALHTVLGAEKILRRTRARHVSGVALGGYEIHHGQSDALAGGEGRPVPCMTDVQGHVLGWAAPEEAGAWSRIWGTYLHGLFEADAFRRAFLDDLRRRRGWMPLKRLTRYSLDPELDRLADTVRHSLDMDAVYALLRPH